MKARNLRRFKTCRRAYARVQVIAALVAAACMCGAAGAQDIAGPAHSPSIQPQNATTPSASSPALPRGKKLVLKDGSFQLVREYQVDGDRIRYYSVDRSQWEEIPAALVDWDATKKEDLAEAKRDAEVVAKAHAEDAERKIPPLDIDASLELAPGVFLPPGEGLFAFDGKGVFRLSPAATDSKLSKRRAIEQVLVPIPIVPARQTVSIQGAHAKLRIRFSQPEFYMRVTDDSEPDVQLIRANVHGDRRRIENLDQLFKQRSAVRDTIPIERWHVAHGVYRYTVGQSLDPGEYAIIETTNEEGTELYVWDFGVDPGRSPAAAGKEK
ncbi:MAG: hypothetical protein ACRD4S_10370 [Candidatus Acidiferrales bacterium]